MLQFHPPEAETMVDEVSLMQAAQQDIRHFAPLYERYAARIYGYCLRRARGGAQEAEDLTSQIFTRVLDKLHTYQGGNVGAWLFRIAHNTLANHYRNRHYPSPLYDDATDTSQGPLEQVIQEEFIDKLGAAIASLPSEQQDLLYLKIEGGLSSPQIGEILGKTPGAIRVELHRVMSKLRDALGEG